MRNTVGPHSFGVIQHQQTVQTAYCYRRSSVSVCLSVATVSLAETPRPVQMPFEMCVLSCMDPKFRLSVPAFRCLHGTAPRYLAETLHLTTNRGSCSRMRSAATSTLIVPATRRRTLGDRAFPVAAARAWNSLPSFVRGQQSLAAFRQQLKTVLFRTSFGEEANA